MAFYMFRKIVYDYENGVKDDYELVMHILPTDPQKYFDEVIMMEGDGWEQIDAGTYERENEYCKVIG